jgi:hypothetical protein
MPTINEFLTNVLSGFENPVGTDRPLIRDIARYQLEYNYDVGVANGVEVMIVRCGISYGYHDPFFKLNYNAARGRMYRTSYHVLYPTQPVVKQADQVWYDEQPELDILPRVMDAELQGSATDKQVGDQMWAMSELVFSRDGVRPIIYSRYKLIEKWCKHWTPEMLNKHYWILAQYRYVRYIEHAGPPTLPVYPYNGMYPGNPMIARNKVFAHQTADKKAPFIGEVPPGAGKSIDYDRFELGNTANLHTFIAETWGEGSAPPPPPPPSVWPRAVKVAARRGVNVRTHPDAGSIDIGTLKQGTDVMVVEQQGDWLKLKEGWIHGDYVTFV